MAKKKTSRTQKSLRFAALVRVSGESQAKHGESLRTQHEQIENAATGMDAIVSKWYEGQEHATPGYERVKLEELLRDAAKKHKLFDAIMVADPTRWSRDNERSDSALNLLRDNGIRFFVLGQEFNLFDPVHRFMLQQFASFSELSAALNLQKAIDNRIARAKRNCPTNGSLPFGRTFDKQTETWGIDKEKQATIKEIARRYIAGEGLKALAAEYGLEHSGLHINLTQRCGSEWPLRFQSPRLNIDETVMLTIPALLPPKTIAAVQRRVELNKTSSHGHSKNRYLLSRMVFCGVCGGSLSGGTIPRSKRRQYRHFGSVNCLHGNVRAEELEQAVVRQLFEVFGNPKALERAIEQATPNAAKAQSDQKRLQGLAKELSKIEKGRDRILSLVAKDTITDAQAEKQLTDLQQRESKLRTELERLSVHLENLPTAKEIQAITTAVSGKYGNKKSTARRRVIEHPINHGFDNMTWEEKRALVESVFGGKDEEGKRLGVYLLPYEGESTNQPKQWSYLIKGHLIEEIGSTVPLDRLITPVGRTRRVSSSDSTRPVRCSVR